MEASSADWANGPQKNGAGNVPVISVSDAINTDSSSQLAITEMSPANHSEHSRKHRQRTVVRERRVQECSNFVVLLPSSELMSDKSMWAMSVISLKSSASTKRPQPMRCTASRPCLRRILLMIRMTSPVKVPVGCNRNIRGSIISGLVRKRSVWETFYR